VKQGRQTRSNMKERRERREGRKTKKRRTDRKKVIQGGSCAHNGKTEKEREGKQCGWMIIG
jgi:hypothetical protein